MARPIEIEAPDGTIVEFPEGTPQSTIVSAMRRSYPRTTQSTSRGSNRQYTPAQVRTAQGMRLDRNARPGTAGNPAMINSRQQWNSLPT